MNKKAADFVNSIVNGTDITFKKKYSYYNGWDDRNIIPDHKLSSAISKIAKQNMNDFKEIGKSLNEIETYEALKSNKKIQDAIDTAFKTLAQNLIETSNDIVNDDIEKQKLKERNQIAKEKHIAERAKRKAKEVADKAKAIAKADAANEKRKAKEAAEKAKIEKQKNEIMSSLSREQKKLVKALMVLNKKE